MTSHKKLGNIQEPGFYHAGETLYLSVKPGGSRSWVQRIYFEGKRHDVGLGSFKLVSRAQARDKAAENRRNVRIHKRHPLAEKRKAKIPTFQAAALQTYTALKPRWRSAKHTRNWLQIMEKYVLPVFGDVAIDKLDRQAVLKILEPLWTRRPETARRLRQKLRAVFGWAQAHGFIENNPAGEMIDAALPKQRAVKAHFRALPYRDIAGALEAVERSGITTSKLALRFLVLTAARSGEVRGATWDEIDLEAKTWAVPAQRMKTNRAHRVPLSDAAVAVLDQAWRLADGSGLVFPSLMKPGKPISNMTLTKLLRDNDLATKATVHGFRSGFRDWCAETGQSRELAEAALAHVVPGVEGAYFRSDLFEKRRVLMQQWADYLANVNSNMR